jgi:hypothetical protein
MAASTTERGPAPAVPDRPMSFIVGFVMLGAITFLPTYLQYVQGTSATASGIRMLPMVLGLLLAAVGGGNVVSWTGRYRVFPIAGSLGMAGGLYLLSRLDEHTGFRLGSLSMFVLGVGVGLSMQVLLIAVQNTVDYADLGVATSGVTFLRTIGSSFGVAVFGSVYAGRLRALAGLPRKERGQMSTVALAHARSSLDETEAWCVVKARAMRRRCGSATVASIAESVKLPPKVLRRLSAAWQEWVAERNPGGEIDLSGALARTARRLFEEQPTEWLPTRTVIAEPERSQ